MSDLISDPNAYFRCEKGCGVFPRKEEATPTLKPVLYLDVDGMLLRHPDEKRFISKDEAEAWWKENHGGGPATGVREFLEWATTHCECRWLTAWGCCGDIGDEGRALLAKRLRVPAELLARVNVNPLGWNGDKTQGINFDEGREWFWLDDETIGRELIPLRERGCENRLVKTDSSRDPDALLKSWAWIRERLNENELAGSISERETLAAELEKIVAICERYGCCGSFYAGPGYAIEAVQRFREWSDGRNTEAKELRAAVARLTTEKAALQSANAGLARDMLDMEAEFNVSREQAIQDIEAVLLILREAPTT